jgi:hypothetical protein
MTVMAGLMGRKPHDGLRPAPDDPPESHAASATRSTIRVA